jgi:hypothetical protein
MAIGYEASAIMCLLMIIINKTSKRYEQQTLADTIMIITLYVFVSIHAPQTSTKNTSKDEEVFQKKDKTRYNTADYLLEDLPTRKTENKPPPTPNTVETHDQGIIVSNPTKPDWVST